MDFGATVWLLRDFPLQDIQKSRVFFIFVLDN